MMKSAILALIILMSMASLFAQYPTIHNTRPRIWVESTRFTELQALISVPGEAKQTYDDVLYAYENGWITDPQLYLVGSDSTLWTWDWSSQYAVNQSLLTVFFYKMTDDPIAVKRCRFIARQVIGLIDTIDFSDMDWYDKEDLLRHISENDVLLDQCYDNFPAGLRDSLAQSLFRVTREFMNTYILSGAGNSYVSSHNTWNNIYCNQNALTLFEASGLTPEQRDTVRQWYETVYDKHINGFIPCWTYYRDDDGGWNWGAAYAMWSLVDQFQLFENMRIGTDKNFYTDLPWIQNSINQYIYFMQPDNKSLHLGDGQTDLFADRVLYLHARRYNDPRSLWLVQYWSADRFMTWTLPKFQKLLYKDFTMPLVTRPDLPLDWWSDKVGLSVSRSSWDSTATMVTFFNSPSKRAAHEHRDNNSFTLFKNAPLIIDAGYYDTYGGSHYRNYYERTIAHNSICVFDSTETSGMEVSNDGGQIRSEPLQNYDDIFLPENQRGKWVQFASGNNYEYNIADAQLSYDPAKLDFFRRRLLYIKPGKVIVLDHVHLNNTQSNQRDISWIAHFKNKPHIGGTIVTSSVPGHIDTYDGNSCRATNGNGSVAIKTLLPDSSTITSIGGAGYEYWVNGVNYPPEVIPDSNFYTPGTWRIEVRPTVVTDTVVFLHTIDISDSTHMAIAGGLAMQNRISVGADWNDTLYYFSNDADTGKTYHVFYNVSGSRNIGIFAADLSAGTYNIRVDGELIITVSTDANGILRSAVDLKSGTHTIEIVLNRVSVNEFNTPTILTVFPNPAHLEVNILFPSSASPFITQIYDISGKLIMRNSNQIKLNISGLTPGPYHILLIQKGKKYSAKFVKQ